MKCEWGWKNRDPAPTTKKFVKNPAVNKFNARTFAPRWLENHQKVAKLPSKLIPAKNKKTIIDYDVDDLILC